MTLVSFISGANQYALANEQFETAINLNPDATLWGITHSKIFLDFSRDGQLTGDLLLERIRKSYQDALMLSVASEYQAGNYNRALFAARIALQQKEEPENQILNFYLKLSIIALNKNHGFTKGELKGLNSDDQKVVEMLKGMGLRIL